MTQDQADRELKKKKKKFPGLMPYLHMSNPNHLWDFSTPLCPNCKLVIKYEARTHQPFGKELSLFRDSAGLAEKTSTDPGRFVLLY